MNISFFSDCYLSRVHVHDNIPQVPYDYGFKW